MSCMRLHESSSSPSEAVTFLQLLLDCSHQPSALDTQQYYSYHSIMGYFKLNTYTGRSLWSYLRYNLCNIYPDPFKTKWENWKLCEGLHLFSLAVEYLKYHKKLSG